MSLNVMRPTIRRQFKSYTKSHPIIDAINTSLMGTRFYEAHKYKELLPKYINDRVIPSNEGNAFVAVFYKAGDTATMVVLYNVEEPRINSCQAFDFLGHFYDRLTIETIYTQPDFTVARPFILDVYAMQNYMIQFNMVTKSYVDDNVSIIINSDDLPTSPNTRLNMVESVYNILRCSHKIMIRVD